MRTDALLWSINERLGGNAGLDVEPLRFDWLDDLASVLKVELEEQEGRD